jgi:putative phosphoesterase
MAATSILPTLVRLTVCAALAILRPMEKIAVIADIHGNLAALHAMLEELDAWSPDLVIVAGDTVNRGPLSGPCLALVMERAAAHGWQVIRGNHERYVLSFDHERRRPDFPSSGPHYELSRSIAWTHAQVADRLETIAAMPEQLRFELDGASLAVFHASVRHDRDGLMRHTPDDELRQQIDSSVSIFCTAHTHMPFTRRLGQTLVVNVGSVGLPFDGDRRAAYARLTRERAGWQATVVRVPYDVAATERAFRESGMLDAAGAHGHLMLRELQTGHSLLFDFVPAYHERILAGSIGLDEAVSEFLARRERAA